MYKFKIVSDGWPDYEIEREIIKVLDESGYKLVGSGYDFANKIRDLGFENPNKFVKRSTAP